MTIVNNGYLGLVIVQGNNYGTVVGVGLAGGYSGGSLTGLVYNNGANFGFQAGIYAGSAFLDR